MLIWTRWGFLIPILWIMGFVVFYWVNHFSNGFVPDQWIVTVGHLLGTILVWLFSVTLGQTDVKEIEDEETGETKIITLSHKFLLLPAKLWGLILTVAVVFFLLNPPPRVWLDEVFLQKEAMEKRLREGDFSDVFDEAKQKIQAKLEQTSPPVTTIAPAPAGKAEPVMREWVNAEGKKLQAKGLGVTIDGGLLKVRLLMDSGREVLYDVKRLSAADQEYVKTHLIK
jgi:hypothetical protein